MDMKKLAIAHDAFRERLSPGLMADDIWGPDSLSLTGFNSQPAAVALFGEITPRIRRALSDSGFPNLGRYYLLELADKKMVCIMNYKEYQWGCLIDLEKVNMGTLISIAMSKGLEELQAAVDA